jgi:hypothetical protein
MNGVKRLAYGYKITEKGFVPVLLIPNHMLSPTQLSSSSNVIGSA